VEPTDALKLRYPI